MDIQQKENLGSNAKSAVHVVKPLFVLILKGKLILPGNELSV